MCLLLRMLYTCSYMRFLSSLLVSPMYCLEHLEQEMIYIKLRVLQVMLPVTLYVIPVTVLVMELVSLMNLHWLQVPQCLV